MYFSILMTDEAPPEQIENHPAYVTGEEAIEAAKKETVRRTSNAQIVRVREGEVCRNPGVSLLRMVRFSSNRVRVEDP